MNFSIYVFALLIQYASAYSHEDNFEGYLFSETYSNDENCSGAADAVSGTAVGLCMPFGEESYRYYNATVEGNDVTYQSDFFQNSDCTLLKDSGGERQSLSCSENNGGSFKHSFSPSKEPWMNYHYGVVNTVATTADSCDVPYSFYYYAFGYCYDNGVSFLSYYSCNPTYSTYVINSNYDSKCEYLEASQELSLDDCASTTKADYSFKSQMCR